MPKSTIHWWARNDVLVPSVSPEKVKLWSYTDLMSLRVIYWLRQRKTHSTGAEIPRATMPSVRKAVEMLRALDIPLWREQHPSVMVRADGTIYLRTGETLETVDGQLAQAEWIDLIAPFRSLEGCRGPDLVQPRPKLRIVPGKLGGSPHIVHTRVETCAISALANDGFTSERIIALYPYLTATEVGDALDLEGQLTQNLQLAA